MFPISYIASDQQTRDVAQELATVARLPLEQYETNFNGPRSGKSPISIRTDIDKMMPPGKETFTSNVSNTQFALPEAPANQWAYNAWNSFDDAQGRKNTSDGGQQLFAEPYSHPSPTFERLLDTASSSLGSAAEGTTEQQTTESNFMDVWANAPLGFE
jgi:hypothetical protein